MSSWWCRSRSRRWWLVAGLITFALAGCASHPVRADVLDRTTQRTPDSSIPMAATIYCRHLAGLPHRITSGDATQWAARVRDDFAALVVAPAAISVDWSAVSAYSRNLVPHFGPGGVAPWPSEPPDVTAARTHIAQFEHDSCGVDT